MVRYENPEINGLAFPKPRRVKKSAARIRRAAAEVDTEGNVVEIPQHDTLLQQCIEVSRSEPGIECMHIPDAVYRLIQFGNNDDKLSWAIDKAVGTVKALQIKQEIAEEIKNKPDLFVFFGLGNGFSLCYQGDVKTGAGRLSQGQKAWGRKTSVVEIRDAAAVSTAIDRMREMAKKLRSENA